MQEAICAAFAKINKTCMPPQDSTGDCYGEKKVKQYGPGPKLDNFEAKNIFDYKVRGCKLCVIWLNLQFLAVSDAVVFNPKLF